MKNNLRKFGFGALRKGFTLIELLISIVIFMVFLGIVSQSYLSIVRTERQANEVRKMYSDVREFMDFLSTEIRLGTVDYDCYGTQVNAGFDESRTKFCKGTNTIVDGETTSLMLVKKGGEEKTLIDFSDGKVLVSKNYRDPSGTWPAVPGYENKVMLAERLEVSDLRFMIFPDVNPYTNYRINAAQFQPKVTIMMSVKNAEGTTTPFEFDFQTTVSSRVYSKKI